jgi:hypothetical protein
MTTPVSARDHANMTVAEREFTFDALLADFEELEDRADEADTSTEARTSAPHVELSVVEPRVVEPRVPGSQISDQRAQPRRAPDAAAPQSEPREAASAAPRAPRRAALKLPTLELPSPQVLKLAGLIVVAALSLTLVFIALSR